MRTGRTGRPKYFLAQNTRNTLPRPQKPPKIGFEKIKMPVTVLKNKVLYSFGSFLADLENKRLWKDEELVPLTPKVFQTFTLLLQNRHEVVTKETLLDTLWPDCHVDSANLTQNISVLRKALNEPNSSTNYIVTFPKRGYRFVGEVRILENSAEAALPAPSPVQEPPSPPPALARSNTSWIAAGLFTALLCVAVVSFRLAPTSGRNDPSLDVDSSQAITHLAGHEYQPAVSPDGRRVAFVHFRGLSDPLRIGIVNRGDPATPEWIDTPGGDAFSPAWSPDGRSLAYLRRKESQLFLVIRDPQAAERTVATLYPLREGVTMRQLDWSPDGRHLAVVDKRVSDEPFHIDLVHAIEGRRSPLTVPPALSDGDFEPRFSPDGKEIALLRVSSRRSMDIVVLRMPGSGVAQQITHVKRPFGGLDWTTDSKSLLFSAKRDGLDRVWSVSAVDAGAAWQPVTRPVKHSVQFSVARTTGQMAIARADPDQNIWRAQLDSPDGDGLHWDRLVASPGNDYGPVFSADGRRVAFLSDRGGEPQLWLRGEDGRETALTSGGLVPNYPSWGNEDRQLYFSSYTQRKLYRVSAAGGTPEPIDVAGPVGGHIAITPDSQSVLLVQRFNVFQAPLRGGPQTLISDQGGFPLRQGPGGNRLYFVRNRFGQEIWELDKATAKVTRAVSRLWPGCWGCWDLAKNGLLVYVTGSEAGVPQLVRLDLNTGKSNVLGKLPSRLAALSKGMLALSPDGRQLLADVAEPAIGDIRWMDIAPKR